VAAQGSLIVQWDDDDWYAPERLRLQVAPLISGEADITGLRADIIFDLPRWKFWRCTPELHHRMFVNDVHGGTLAFQRWVWEKLVRYPDRSLAEDAAFLRQAVRKGARLLRLDGTDLFIYLRHDSNAWSFVCGQFLAPKGWQEVPEPTTLAKDQSFYAAHSHAAAGVTAEKPLVSCIMPTCNRRPFVAQAIRYFMEQDYPNKELVIVDDGTDCISDLVPDSAQIRYIRLQGKHTLGAKRNLACREARGEIVLHWDDDDWMAGWRIRYQVECLLSEGADICGLDNIYFYDPARDRAWRYVYANQGRAWVYGGTLCYRRAFWQAHPFLEVNVGEDTHFVWSSSSPRVVALKDSQFYIATIHANNTSPKRTTGKPWQPCPPEVIRQFAGDALSPQLSAP
jgi:glycosyltransferase involved in cell wall biosynthesis